MTSYDEDLMANRFFISMVKTCPELYTTAKANRWTVCVPKTGTFKDTVLTEMDYQNHVLVPVESGDHGYQTVHGKQVFVRDGTIITGTGFDEVRSVPILFEETFFNEEQQSYRIICLATLLEGGLSPDEDVIHGINTPPSSLNECKQLLWGHDDGKKIKKRINEQIDILNHKCDSIQGESLDLYIEAANTMFTNCTQVLLRDRMLKTMAENDEAFAEKLKVAVETYTMHGVYPKLYRGIAASLAVTDAKVNKIIRNLSHIQIQDLRISTEFVHNIPRARKALSDLVTFSTPMGKLLCIKRVVSALRHSAYCDDRVNPENRQRPMTTDDLLPMLIFMIIKSQIGNWSAHLCYMKDFRFSKSKNDDEFGYFLASFEAALEHLVSEQLNPDQLDYFSYPLTSWALQSLSPYGRSDNRDGLSRLKDFFTAVRGGELAIVRNMLGENPPKQTMISPTRCHPLCSCEQCERSSASRNSSRTLLSCDERGFTALHVAAWYGQIDVLESLLISGGTAIVHTSSGSGSTALHLACQRGHQNIMLLLLHYGSDPGAIDGYGNTPLHLSVGNGHEECVKGLIYYYRTDARVNINVTNDVGDTPLHCAARWGYENIVRVLLENGASIAVRNRKKQTPVNCANTIRTYKLILAVAEKEGKTLRFSTIPTPKQATDAARITRDKARPVAALSTSPEKPTTRTKSKTLDRLLRSIADGDLHLVRYLMGWSSESESEEDGEETITSKRELCHPLCQCRKCIPLQRRQSFSSRSDIAGVNASGNEGITCLHVAVLNGQTKIAELLLRKGADADLGNTTANVSPLHLACQYNKPEMVKLLLSYGAKIDRVDFKSNSPLHFCAMNGCTNAAEVLLANRVDINATNARGDTPLHESVRWNMKYMAALLLKHGAKTDIRNELRLTASQLAKANETMMDLFHKFMSESAEEISDRRTSLPSLVICAEKAKQPSSNKLITVCLEVDRVLEGNQNVRTVDESTDRRSTETGDGTAPSFDSFMKHQLSINNFHREQLHSNEMTNDTDTGDVYKGDV